MVHRSEQERLANVSAHGVFTHAQLRFPSTEMLRDAIESAPQLTWVFSGDSLRDEGSSPEVAPSETFVSGLVGRVRGYSARRDDSVIDSTRSRNNSLTALLAELESRVLRFQPDIVVLTCPHDDIEDSNVTHEQTELTVRTIIEQCREQGALVVLNLPFYFPSSSFMTSVDRLVKLEALRGSALESGAIVVDHWSVWESKSHSEWYLTNRKFPSQQGIREMVDLCSRQCGIDVQRVATSYENSETTFTS